MTTEEALTIIDKALAALTATRADHVTLQTAVQTVKAALGKQEVHNGSNDVRTKSE